MNYILYQLPNINDDILNNIKKNGFKQEFSEYLLQPQLSNGFNNFIHKSKDKMIFVEDPKYKNKNFYHVTNPYEHTITNNSKDKLDIASYSKIYFTESNKLNIVSRAFYKLWEMLMIFDVIPDKNIVSAHLAEAPGSFVQALIFFREKYFKKAIFDKDEHYVISISEKGVPTFKADFKREYSRVKIYEQDGGDLTSLTSINKFSKFSKKADFITADGGFIWNDENYQEQEAFKLVIGEILTALKIQEINGSFILKLFEIYTDVSIKIIAILKMLYSEVYITKPLTSRPSNSERYVICKKFKGIDNKIINKFEDLLKEINDKEKENFFLADILPDYEIDINFKYTLNISSIILSDIQHESINKMIKYINSGNYYGNMYHKYLEAQQNANDLWTSTFYPIDANDIKVVKNNLEKLLKETSEESIKQIKTYSEKLI